MYLELKHSDITVAKVDATKFTHLASEYGVHGYPTIKLYDFIHFTSCDYCRQQVAVLFSRVPVFDVLCSLQCFAIGSVTGICRVSANLSHLSRKVMR